MTAGAGNHPPLAVGTLADVTLLLGADAVAVDVAGAFRDPDDDALTHTAATSDTSVATVSVLGTQVTITQGGAGLAIITVTATDAVGSNQSAEQRFKVTVGNDYDTDGDRLIEIRTLAQLDAMRHNLHGRSVPDDDAFELGFPDSIDHWGCGFEGCSGYELEADLDFDTDGSGDAGADDTYWNGGAGWAPIGIPEFFTFGAFNTTFDGNGHVIANLFVRGADFAGLFGALGQSGVIRNLSATDVDVVGVDSVGGLVGNNHGAVIASMTTGKVSGDDGGGGLVGVNDGTITRSRSFATVTRMRVPLPPCDSILCVGISYDVPGTGGLVGVNLGDITSSYATGAVDGLLAGGLAGYNGDTIVSSYATGPVTGQTAGGLVGRNGRGPDKIYASYATGSVSGGRDVGGLVGYNAGRIDSSYATGGELAGGGNSYYTTASYWDSTTSGISGISEGSTTAQLQAPTGYSGIYGEWNLDLDHDGTPDHPWHFGTAAQYPALSVDFDGDGRATWQEFGHQLRAGPTLTVTSAMDQAVLTWTAVDSGHWTPPPGITYTVYRHNGATVENLVENLDAREYTDSDVADGPYIYQVAAVVDGGQATHSARMGASTGSNNAPDLVVDAPTVSDSSPLVSAFFTLSATVRNSGGSAAGSATLTYYRSSNATISTRDTSVGTDPVSGLNPAASSAESIGLRAPANAGTYYYGACVGSVANESDTTNNCSAAVRLTVVAPDLAVDAPTVSNGSPLAGASLTLSATVRNQGGSAAGSTTLTYYRSSDATITTGDSQVGTDPVSRLGAGNTSAESIPLTAPSSAGIYYYGACVGSLWNESDTTNNCSTAVRVTVIGPPDLVVGTPTVSDSSPLAGASLTLSATVRNQGGSAAGSTTLTYYRSSDATISTSDTSVGTDAVSGLGAGNTSAESIGLTAPATTGTYYYGACVGPVANESDTTNNCSTAVRVTVVAPDVVVDAPTVSNSNPTAGASFTLIATVRNQGGSAAGSTTLGYYRSSDATITTGDSQVGTDPVSGLGAGNTSAESIGLTAPATVGTYYYGACVGSVANESDTTNNCSVAVRVTAIDLLSDPFFPEETVTLEVDENSREGTVVGEPVAARYAGNDPLSYSLAGTGAELFTIDGTGQIKVGKRTGLDHETRDIYTITVRVTDRKDADGNPDDTIDDTIMATINVKDVNEPPAISGDENLTIVENTAAATTLQSYGASDPEGVTTTFTWSLSGTDRGDFEISSAGFLTFKNVPDYERPADSGGNNEYNIQIRANDGSLTGTRNVTVTVSDANEDPTITGDDTLTYPENTATTRVLDRYSATDPEGRPITWTVGGTDAGDFNIDPSGNLTFDGIPDHENPADAGGNNVYDIQVVATDDGHLGDGTASPGGAMEKGFDVTVTVTPVNEPPTVSGDTAVSVDENTEAFSLTYTASDPEGDSTTFTWSLSGTDGGDFSIDRNKGILTFRDTPNYESPADGNRDNEYRVTVRVSDGQYTGTLDVIIDVDDVNEPPTITGSATPADFPENSTRSVATYLPPTRSVQPLPGRLAGQTLKTLKSVTRVF